MQRLSHSLWPLAEAPKASNGAAGERRPTGTEPRKSTEPGRWAVRSTGWLGQACSDTTSLAFCSQLPCMHLLDHLVRLAEECWRNGETERLGSLEVNHQLESHPLLDG